MPLPASHLLLCFWGEPASLVPAMMCPQSGDSYSPPEAGEQPAQPDDNATPPPEDDSATAPDDSGGGDDSGDGAPPPSDQPE